MMYLQQFFMHYWRCGGQAVPHVGTHTNARANAHVYAYANAHVYAYANAHVYAYANASAIPTTTGV